MANEKSCPGWCEHPEQQMAMEGFSETTISTDNHNTKPGPISRLLGRGQENAVSLRQLEALTGHDGRTVRLMIHRERLNGIPILADNQSGYYLPASTEEKERCVRSMRHRAKEIWITANHIEDSEIGGGE